MEEGHNTRYYEGPSGVRVPWMKEHVPPQEETRRSIVHAVRRELYIARVALTIVWHDIIDRTPS